MADTASQIREANRLLEEYGVKKSVTAPTLVAAAQELKKPLRAALEYVAKVMRVAEGIR